MSNAVSDADGRFERTAATRRRILEEARELLLAGVTEPTAQEIADAAEVTRRTLFRHFSDMETLYRSLVEEAEHEVMSVRDEVIQYNAGFDATPEANRETLLAEIIDRRARVYETLLPLYVSHVWTRYRASRREAYRSEWVKRGRQRLTEALPARITNDEALFNAIDATLSIEYWANLRRDQRLSVGKARAVVESAVAKLKSV